MRKVLLAAVVMGAAITGGVTVPPVNAELEPHGRWVDVGPMPNRRGAPVAVRLADGRVLVAGGFRAHDAGCKRNADIYDPKADHWQPAHPMYRQQCDARSALLRGGRVLVVGGTTVTASGLSRVARGQIYLPSKDRWRWTAPIPVPRSNPIVEPIGPQRVLVTGGGWCRGSCASAFIYHLRRDRWTRTDPMPVTGLGSSVVLRGGNVLVAVDPNDENGIRIAQRYMVQRHSWRPAGTYRGRSEPILFRTSGGDVLAIPGGTAHVGEKVVHRFDPGTNDWSRGSTLPVAREGAQVVALHGSPLLLGGLTAGSGADTTRTALLWRPARREWVRWTRIPQPVWRHVAVKLDAGSILLIGGQTELGEGGNQIPRKLAYRYYL